MTHRLLVLSDIDGTVVPHPFFSGKSLEERRPYFERLLALFPRPNFGFVTGRREEGFLRFFREYGGPIRWPSILAIENGMHLALRGNWIHMRPQNPLLARIMADLEAEVRAIPELNAGHDPVAFLANGRIRTYYLELKRCCAQIEIHFDDPELRRRFLNIVERHVNPHLVDGVSVQCFLSEGRLDLWESGLVPKTGFWDSLELELPALGVAPLGELTVMALGDEFYDAYLFSYLKNKLGDRLGRVVTVAVGRSLPAATHQAAGVDEALSLVEAALGEPEKLDESLRRWAAEIA